MLEVAGHQEALPAAENAFPVTCGPCDEWSVHLFDAVSGVL